MKQTIAYLCFIFSAIVAVLSLYNFFLFGRLIIYPEIIKSNHSTIYYLGALAGYFLFASAEGAFAYFLFRLGKNTKASIPS